MKISIPKIIYASLVYLFLYLPLVVLVIFSFNHSPHSLLWHGFTTHWYHALVRDPELLTVAWHSLAVSVSAASISTIIGLLGAVALYKYQFRGKHLLQGLIFILIVVPDLVVGISLLVLFTMFHVALGFGTLLIAHITFCIPFVVVMISGRLSDFNKNLLEVALDLGANEYIVFHKIILPLLKPAIIAAWLLAFALSMDDVIISYFVSGPSFQILPLYIYSQVKVGPTPEINALCTVLMAVTFTMVIFAQVMMKKKA